MRDITLCNPRLQSLAHMLIEICAEAGLYIAISETLRTVEEQNELYAQGRTKPGRIVTNAKGDSYASFHQWGTAFDFYFNDNLGAYNYKSNGKERVEDFKAVGEIGKSLGLEWGGDWKSPIDKPHFQLPDWGSTTAKIRELYKTPDEFRKTWEVYVKGWNKDHNGFWYADSEKSFIASQWAVINNRKYYFNSDGYAVTNWQEIDGFWYYFEPTKGHDYECALYVTDKDGKQDVGIFE